MHRLTRPTILRALAASAVLLATAAHAGTDPPAGPDESPTSESSPIYVFLNAPADLDAFWKMLKDPDFVLLRGGELRRRLDRAGAGPVPDSSGAWAVVVGSVAVDGETSGDDADLAIEYGVQLGVTEPTWVPIRLDNQMVIEAREADRELPLRVVAGGGWQVELRGAGAHRVRVRAKLPLKATAEGHRLEFAIPEAASTRFRLDVAEQVVGVAAGGEPVDRAPMTIKGRAATRLSAHLSPRSRLELSWQVESEPSARLGPLLSLRGEIAVDIDPGSFRTRSSWTVHSVRGATRRLEFRIDPEDDVLELKLDDQPVPATIERLEVATLMTISLPEPLRPGAPKRLIMTTKRPLATKSAARPAFNGFPLTNAQEQSGVIGIAQGGDLWISGAAGRGLRRVDPRTELPAELRGRPGTALAYRFVDQPFELALRVDLSPPLVRTDARTTVSLDARRARVETWLQLHDQAAHGRPFDLVIGLPRGLELESVGPRDVVAMSAEAPEGEAAEGLRRLTVRLTPRAQQAGEIPLHLIGRQAIDPARPVGVALFRPRGTLSEGGRIAVLTDRDLTVDLAGPGDGVGGAEAFRPALQGPPADWPWPADRIPAGPPALWLRHDGDPAALPLRVTVHPRAVSHATTLLVQVGRGEVEVRQETECAVHFGALDHLDIESPAALQDRWEVDEGEVARPEDLGTAPEGRRRFRLRFAKPVADRVRLKFRFRLRPAPPREPEHPVEVAIPWLRVVEGASAPMRVQVSSDPGIDLDGGGPGWARTDAEGSATAGEAEPIVRYTLVGDEAGAPPKLVATTHPLTALPSLLASRALLRTIQSPEGELRTSASYWVEAHRSTLSVALPPGSRWVRARIGGEAISRVETLPRSAGYRFRFPPQTAAGGVLVELEYRVPGPLATTTWIPPQLLDDGLVQETLWEVRIPWNRALVGVPPGWTDENRWYWDRYVWKRRPWMGAAALTAWVGGATPRAPRSDGPDGGVGDDHSYLFGRSGQPDDLRLTIASRAGLVAVCSGPVLGLGVLLLFWRPPLRIVWAAVLALVLTVAVAVQPSVTLLAIQSSVVGVGFTLLAVVMQRLVERRRRSASAVFGRPSSMAIPPVGSMFRRAVGVGSDDPTELRARPVSSSADHPPNNLSEAPQDAGIQGAPPEQDGTIAVHSSSSRGER
ncbi:MAG: hypothetical protein JO116_06530 [Planctomycetaceae bacterium]|nr:hypothetical protein [Planctomycetaceae bacterium]